MADLETALRGELDAWCQSYVTAFSAYDPPGIAAHWAFPAMILQSGRRFIYDSEEKFIRNTDNLLGFYKAEGVAKAERKLLVCLALGPDAAAMSVSDRMPDKAGGLIVAWEAAYMLQRVEGRWRAISAVADGETAAWAARGTPLGGKS